MSGARKTIGSISLRKHIGKCEKIDTSTKSFDNLIGTHLCPSPNIVGGPAKDLKKLIQSQTSL